jgi:hypothetical protein
MIADVHVHVATGGDSPAPPAVVNPRDAWFAVQGR